MFCKPIGLLRWSVSSAISSVMFNFFMSSSTNLLHVFYGLLTGLAPGLAIGFFSGGHSNPLFSFQGVTEIFQCIYCSSLPNLFLFSLRQKNAGLWLSVRQGIILCVNYAHLCIIANAG